MPPTDDRPSAAPTTDADEIAALRTRVAALEAEAAALRHGLAAPDAAPGPGRDAPSAADGAALRQILDGVTDYAVVAADLDRRIVAWSEGARRLFGWTEAEALGHRCDLMFTPEDRADGAPERETAAALAGGGRRTSAGTCAATARASGAAGSWWRCAGPAAGRKAW